MNITRDVMTDLLPVYFSGEASEDTRQLVEMYFRENPDFERIARAAAMPLEQLRRAAPVQAEAEREKCAFERARKEFLRRSVVFGVALLFTFAPLMPVLRDGRLVWTAFLNNPWQLTLFWCVAGLFWFQYAARPSRRATAMTFSIFLALLPVVVVFHLFLPGWRTGLGNRVVLANTMWITAALLWAFYNWRSHRHRIRTP